MSKYPSTFYRVSVKALIRNRKGDVLVCKERSDNWSLPGGGIDHGEDPLDALHREMQEELGVQSFTNEKLSSVMTFYADEKESWLMWIVYEVRFPDFNFSPGEDVNAVAFMDVKDFEGSDIRSETLVLEAVRRSS